MVQIKVFIRCPSGEKQELLVEDDIVVAELKGRLESIANVPKGQQRLIFKGHVLNDEHTLKQIGVADEDVMHLVRKSQQQAPSASPTPSTVGQGRGGGLPGGMPGMEMFQQNPELMQSIMNSPMMQSLMDNPELIRQMMMANPQMQAVLENNPHLSHVLNDPELLRQSMNAARNPAMMQEMMRNQDRAMANIESLPGGYNALMRMYQDVHEPMMEAAEQAATASGSTSNANSASGSAGPQNSPMPNPWGSSSPPQPPPAAPFGSGGASQSPFPFGGSSGGENLFSSFLSQMQQSQASTQQGSSTAPRGSNPFANPFMFFPMGANTSQSQTAQQPRASATASTTATGPSLEGPNPWAPPSSADSPEVKYKSQLEQLENMGFPDKKANIQALLRNNGNVNSAVESLIEDLAKQ